MVLWRFGAPHRILLVVVCGGGVEGLVLEVLVVLEVAAVRIVWCVACVFWQAAAAGGGA